MEGLDVKRIQYLAKKAQNFSLFSVAKTDRFSLKLLNLSGYNN